MPSIIQHLERRCLLASISGTLKQDTDGDGIGDTWFAGQKAFIDINDDRLYGPGDLLTQSDISANYTFTGLAAGTYKVYQVLFANGWRQSAPAEPAFTITLTANQNSTGNHFAQTPDERARYITGTFDFDENRNGNVDDHEYWGIEFQNVYLDLNDNGTLDFDEPVRLTSPLGDYQFPNISPGSYKVRYAEVGDYTLTGPISEYTATVTDTNNSFGNNFTVAPVSATGGTVTGILYSDVNGDGVRQSSETFLKDRTLYVDSNNNQTLDAGELSTTSLYGGYYALRGLPLGTHFIRQLVPTGWVGTQPSSGASRTVTITGTTPRTGQHFGSRNVSATANGKAFDDSNANGIFDVGDVVYSNRRVYVDLNNDRTWQADTEPSAVSDSLGSYSIAPITPGTYPVRQILSNGYDATSGVNGLSTTFAAQATVSNLDFGQRLAGNTTEIRGTVWQDTDRDGVFDANELGLANRTVYDDVNNNGVYDIGERYSLTNSSGLYRLIGMPGGTHSVRQFIPSGWAQTVPASNASRSVSVSTNGVVTSINFGARLLDVIAPTVSQWSHNLPNTRNVAVQFSEAMNASSITASDLVAVRSGGGSTVATSVSYNTSTFTATFTFGQLADGDYTFRVPAGSVSDLDANVNAADLNFSNATTFILAGDFDRDRTVDFDDLLILSQNYGQTGKNFSQGNLDYSADGLVGFDDLLLLAQRYGTTLLSAASASTVLGRKTRDRMAGLGL